MIDVKKLRIYNSAREVRKEIYESSKKFSDEEKYGLTSQINRSANSIGANIAEGAGRRTKADFHRFLFIAYGSLKEVRHHLEVSRENKFITQEEFLSLDDKLDKLGGMMTLFLRSSSRSPG